MDSQQSSIKSYKCIKCSTIFNKKRNYKQHINRSTSCLDKTITVDDLLIILNEHENQISELKRQIEFLKKKSTHNKNIINDIERGIINGMKIESHNSRNLDSLDNDTIVKSIKECDGSENILLCLIEKTYFNPDHLNVSNINIPSLSRSKTKIFDGDKWILVNTSSAISNLHRNYISFLKDKYNTFIKNDKSIKSKSFENFISQNMNGYTEDLENNIKMLLYNNKNFLKTHTQN